MNAKNGTGKEVKYPKSELNLWKIDPGNNSIYDIDKTFERQYSMLVKGQPKENVELYRDYLKRAKFEGISVVRRVNYIRALRVFKEVIGRKPLSEISKEDTDGFLDAVSGNSPATMQMRFYCLRKFLQFIGKGELVEGVRPPNPSGVKVKASDLLSREDVQKMVDVVGTTRGKAFVTMLYESGARIGELLNVQIRDLEFDEHGVKVSLDGKTGRRLVRLVESASYLREWVDLVKKTHPDAPYLWFGLNDQEPAKHPAVLKFVKELGKKANLGKNVYPHLFRHSRASELAQKLREPQLRAFMGWTGASDMPQVYIHLSAQDMDEAILGLYGNCSVKSESESLDEMRKFYEVWKAMKALD
jgi:site-specific recombinase XerC